jgi:hypothetical protein
MYLKLSFNLSSRFCRWREREREREREIKIQEHQQVKITDTVV